MDCAITDNHCVVDMPVSGGNRIRTISTGSENECKNYLKEQIKQNSSSRQRRIRRRKALKRKKKEAKQLKSTLKSDSLELNDGESTSKKRKLKSDFSFSNEAHSHEPQKLLETRAKKTSTSDFKSFSREKQSFGEASSSSWSKNDKPNEANGDSQSQSRYPEVDSARSSNSGEVKLNGVAIQTIPTIPDNMYVALDCEMVGAGPKGSKSVLARCSILDYDGQVIYDRYIRPEEPITDFRTRWSGILPRHMVYAVPMSVAVREIHACLKNKIMIGHAIYHDFKVMGMFPKAHLVRDTHSCRRLITMAGLEGQGNGLKKLSLALLGRSIQVGNRGHCSVEDARATLDLFKLVRKDWEPELYAKWQKKGLNLGKLYQDLIGGSARESGNFSECEDFLHDKFWT